MEISKKDRRKLRGLKEMGDDSGPISVLSIDTGARVATPAEEPPGPDTDAAPSQEAQGSVTVLDLDKGAAEPMPDLALPVAETLNLNSAEEELRKKYARVIEIGIDQFIKSVQKKIDWAESRKLFNKRKLFEHGIDLDDFEFGRSDDPQKYTDNAFQEIAKRLGAGEKIEHIQNVAKAAAEKIEKESGSELGKFIILIERLQAEEKDGKKSGAARQPAPAPVAATPPPPDKVPIPPEKAEENEEYFNPEQKEELNDFIEAIKKFRDGFLADLKEFGKEKYWDPLEIDFFVVPAAREIFMENFFGHAGLSDEDMDQFIEMALEEAKKEEKK